MVVTNYILTGMALQVTSHFDKNWKHGCVSSLNQSFSKNTRGIWWTTPFSWIFFYPPKNMKNILQSKNNKVRLSPGACPKPSRISGTCFKVVGFTVVTPMAKPSGMPDNDKMISVCDWSFRWLAHRPIKGIQNGKIPTRWAPSRSWYMEFYMGPL